MRFPARTIHLLSIGAGMQTSSWITMVVIMGIVWGGFIWLLTTAMRAESRKDPG